MSEYTIVECDIEEESHLITGLKAVGFNPEFIEVHNAPATLQGYHGAGAKANVIIRKEEARRVTGCGYSDIGFEKVDGAYKAHIDRSSQTWWNKNRDTMYNHATAAKATEMAKKRGYRVTQTEEEGRIRLKLRKSY